MATAPLLLMWCIINTLVLSSLQNENGRSTDPIGHMQPLGSHRSPDSVDDVTGFLSPEEFMDKYVKHSKPLVFRGAAKQFPAYSMWTEKLLKERYGDLEFRLEGKREKEGRMPIGAIGIGRDTLSSFIDTYHDTNRYIVSELPTPMWNDVSVLPSLSCGPFIDRFVEIDMWMSGGGTSSMLHKDAYNTINCVVNGTKEWSLIEFKHQDKIYQFQESTEGVGGFSRINVSAVDLYRFPLVSGAPWSFTTINRGDCLYLPGSMWHQVKSFGSMNVAVAFLFSRFEDKTKKHGFSNCKSETEDLEKYVPLNEVDVDLQFPGHGLMTMGVFDFENGKESLMDNFNKKGQFSVKRAAWSFKESWEGGTKEQHERKAIGLLKLLRKWTGKETGAILTSDVESISRSGLREIITYIHPEIPENSLDYEYFYINDLAIGHVIRKLLDQHGVLRKTDFLKAYIDHVGGTQKFGERVYSRLQTHPEEKEVLTVKEVKSRLKYAIFRFMRGDADEAGFVHAGDEEDAFQSEKDYAVDEELWEGFLDLDDRKSNNDADNVANSNRDRDEF